MASTPTIISAEDIRASPTSYSRPPPGSPMPRGPTRSPPMMSRARSRRTRSLGPAGRVRLPTRRVRPPRRTRAISSAEPEPVSLSSEGHDEEHAVTVTATHHDAGRPYVPCSRPTPPCRTHHTRSGQPSSPPGGIVRTLRGDGAEVASLRTASRTSELTLTHRGIPRLVHLPFISRASA
jgi:hypothetical protein